MLFFSHIGIIAEEHPSESASGSNLNQIKLDDAFIPLVLGQQIRLEKNLKKESSLDEQVQGEIVPLWKKLDHMTEEDRLNSTIELELSGQATLEELNSAQLVSELWKKEQFDAAINLLKTLEDKGETVGLGIAWKTPKTSSAGRALDYRIGGSNTEGHSMHLDFDAQNGNLFCAIRWGSTTSSAIWTLNISTDNGLTWAETYDYGSASGIIDIDCVVVDDFVYVAYVSNAAASDARLRRFTVDTGAEDTGYFYEVIFDAGANSISDVALASNADDFDNRLYYAAIQSDNSLRFAYDLADDGTTFSEASTAGMEPSFGLDMTWDNSRSNCDSFIFLSFNDTSGDIHVMGRAESSWNDWVVESSIGSFRRTTISAYQDSIICAYEYPYSSGTGIRYQISYNCGETWSPGSLAIPDGTSIFGYFEPSVDARDNDGLAIIYQAEGGEFDPMLYRKRDGFMPGPWSDPVLYNDYDVYTGSRTCLAHLPPMGAETFSHGAMYLSLDPDFRTPYFDRPFAHSPIYNDVTPPQVQIDSPSVNACACPMVSIMGSVGDTNGTYVSDVLEYRRRGSSSWVEIDEATSQRTGLLYEWDPSGLVEDYYDLRITAKNESGLMGSDSVLIFLPQTFDSAMLTQPVNGGVYGGEVCVQGTAATTACFEQYTVSYRPSGGATWIAVDPAYLTYGAPVQNGSLAVWDTTALGLSDGTYDLRLLAETECGQTANDTLSLIIDNTSPTAELTIPGTCSSYLPGSSIEIHGEVFDANLLEWTLAVIGGPYSDWTTIAGPSSSNISGLLTTWNTIGLAECSYSFRLFVSDEAAVDCSPSPNVTATIQPHDLMAFATLKLGGLAYPSEIRGQVWADLNGNGIQEPGEIGISNVTLDLISSISLSVLDSGTTDNDGNFGFQNLPAGAFQIHVTDTQSVLTGGTLTAGTNPHMISLGSGETYNAASFGYSGLDLPLHVNLVPGVAVQGLLPIQIRADLLGENPPVTFEWEVLTTGEVFHSQANPFVFDHVLDASHGSLDFQVSVWDSEEGPTTDMARILIAVDPDFYDANGDGCNTLEDWWVFYELWNHDVPDPNGDGHVDVRDFLYLNKNGDCLSKTMK